MAVINFRIICNWSNEESDTQAQKRICTHLEEQLADSTSKTTAFSQQKIKKYNCSRPSQVPYNAHFNLKENIIITKNEQRRCKN